MKTNVSLCPRVAIASVAALFALGACGSESPDSDTGDSAADGGEEAVTPPDPGPSEPSPRPEAPDDEDQQLPPTGPEAEVRWVDGSLVVVALGSSSCPPEARSVEVVSDSEWVIDVTPQGARNVPCTADLAPHRSRIAAPAAAEPDTQVSAVILDNGQRSEPIPVVVSDAPRR